MKPYNEGEERKGNMREKRRMISEAARQLGLETYNLRTWEEEFSLVIGPPGVCLLSGRPLSE